MKSSFSKWQAYAFWFFEIFCMCCFCNEIIIENRFYTGGRKLFQGKCGFGHIAHPYYSFCAVVGIQYESCSKTFRCQENTCDSFLQCNYSSIAVPLLKENQSLGLYKQFCKHFQNNHLSKHPCAACMFSQRDNFFCAIVNYN